MNKAKIGMEDWVNLSCNLAERQSLLIHVAHTIFTRNVPVFAVQICHSKIPLDQNLVK